jgi:hypothetical protein
MPAGRKEINVASWFAEHRAELEGDPEGLTRRLYLQFSAEHKISPATF